MKKQYCVKYGNLPTKLPLLSTVVMFLVLDYYHLPDLVRGICYTIWSVLWIIAITSILIQKPVDLFENNKPDPTDFLMKEAKSRLQEKLEKMAKERGYTSNKN